MNSSTFLSTSEISQEIIINPKNTVCKKCKSEILIESIKEEEDDFKITYTCENKHKYIDEPLTSFFNFTCNNQIINTLKGKCMIHPSEEISYYCHDCKENICKNCRRASNNHLNHKCSDLFEDGMLIKKKKDNILNNLRTYIDSLDNTKSNILNQIDDLKNKVEKYFNKINNYINFQYYFISNFDLNHLSYNNIQSNSFLIDIIKNEDILPSNFKSIKLKELINFLENKKTKKNEYCNTNSKISVQPLNVIRLKYDIKDISNKTQIFGTDFEAFTPSNCKIIIDKEELKENEFDYYYKFKSTGIHNVELKITNDNKELNLTGMFRYCLSLIEADFSDFTSTKVVSLNNAFNGCINLKKVNFDSFYTNNLTSLASMFNSCKSLEYLDLSKFKTPKLKEIRYMFFGCVSLKEIDLSSIDVSNVKDISFMFYCCYSLKKIYFPNWNTSNITSMNETFYFCFSLVELDVSKWNTYNCHDFRWTFDSCCNLKKLDIKNWNPKIIVESRAMFKNCNLVEYLDISHWSMKNNKDLAYMFYSCVSLVGGDFSKWKTHQDAKLSGIFKLCKKLDDCYKFIADQ